MKRILIITIALAFINGCSGLTSSHIRPNNQRNPNKTLVNDHLKNAPRIHSQNEDYAETYDDTDSPLTLRNQSIQAEFDQALDLCQASQNFWQQDEYENAFQALDQAYSLLLSIDTSNDPKLSQQKEDIRFIIFKRNMEIYASRNTTVNGKFNAIPIVINNEVKKEIKLFTTSEKDFFEQSLIRSGKFRPRIVELLNEAGLPTELSWLPLVESGFKLRALSKARALGLWQFIPSTGYKFGLQRDEFIDERLDPEKSTRAAIAYLTELHKMFGDWSTVLAAYNCGEGRVLKTIQSQNVNYLDNFWDLYGKLPNETARYVPRFIATLEIVNNPHKYGIDLSHLDQPDAFDTVTISKQVHLKNIAERLNVPASVIYDLNPHLRYQISPNYPFDLKVPLTNGDKLLASINEISISNLPQRDFAYHRVKKGESIGTISKKYKTNAKTIAQANKIKRNHRLTAGKILKIPYKVSMKNNQLNKTDGTASYNAKDKQHVVKRGDSIWNIAKRYQITAKAIREKNNLSSGDLSVGQVLKIPVNKSHIAKTSKNVYRVKQGDNPFSIAKEHNMDVSRLRSLNQLSLKSRIFPGQKLYVE
jgi:membrane-bound lytic murein transglycosylase D